MAQRRAHILYGGGSNRSAPVVMNDSRDATHSSLLGLEGVAWSEWQHSDTAEGRSTRERLP